MIWSRRPLGRYVAVALGAALLSACDYFGASTGKPEIVPDSGMNPSQGMEQRVTLPKRSSGSQGGVDGIRKARENTFLSNFYGRELGCLLPSKTFAMFDYRDGSQLKVDGGEGSQAASVVPSDKWPKALGLYAGENTYWFDTEAIAFSGHTMVFKDPSNNGTGVCFNMAPNRHYVITDGSLGPGLQNIVGQWSCKSAIGDFTVHPDGTFVSQAGEGDIVIWGIEQSKKISLLAGISDNGIPQSIATHDINLMALVANTLIIDGKRCERMR